MFKDSFDLSDLSKTKNPIDFEKNFMRHVRISREAQFVKTHQKKEGIV